MNAKSMICMAICCSAFAIAPGAAQPAWRSEAQTHVTVTNTCTLLADGGPVWLWVFEETEGDGDGGRMLYEGRLARGEKKVIRPATDRVRYSFRTDDRAAENEEMHGNVGAWCYKGNTIRVP